MDLYPTILVAIVSAIFGSFVTYYIRKYLAFLKANTDKYNDAISRLEKVLESIVEDAIDYLDEVDEFKIGMERVQVGSGPVRVFRKRKSISMSYRESRRLLMLVKTKQLRVVCETIYSVNKKIYGVPGEKLRAVRRHSDAIFENNSTVHSLADLADSCANLYSHFMRHPIA